MHIRSVMSNTFCAKKNSVVIILARCLNEFVVYLMRRLCYLKLVTLTTSEYDDIISSINHHIPSIFL